MNLEQLVYSHVPSKSRQSSGGWLSFNCPCCIEEGEPSNDIRMRGGLRSDGDSVAYHCFNCGFTASHKQGRTINQKFVKFMRCLGISDSDIKLAQIQAIRDKELALGPQLFITRTQTTRIPSFKDIELPEDALSLEELIRQKEPPEGAILAAHYLIERGVYDHTDAYWSPQIGFRNRVIFPFWQGDRIVGYSARDYTNKAESKYMMQVNAGFLYNIDKIKEDTAYLIVVEGVIEAAALDAVGVLTNEASQDQIDYINQFKGEVIVCPDRDKPGEKLVKQAQENGWSVSFPNWESDLKDAADAVQRYGKLYTLKSIIDGRISNNTKISVKMRLK